MSGLELALNRKRALAGVIYYFTQRSVPNNGGRIPMVLNKIWQVLAGGVAYSDPKLDELHIIYRRVTSDSRSVPVGRVRFRINWETHDLQVMQKGEALNIDNESMLEEISPILLELAEYTRVRSIQSQVNYLEFFVNWLPHVMNNPAELARMRAEYGVSSINDRDREELSLFERFVKSTPRFAPGALKEQSVVIDWIDAMHDEGFGQTAKI